MARFRLTAKNNHGSSNELKKGDSIIVEAVSWSNITHEQVKEAIETQLGKKFWQTYTSSSFIIEQI
ncbi:hypothetical protein [uncultured Duncaniella sp.]|uniref:hypothetical protein n=1 Tax=uncultured Duncaniella sp. TaxID=2768039 RepID=UPI00272BEB75|nr:hypothetical protein [uncultured Duncaniella sp.]